MATFNHPPTGTRIAFSIALWDPYFFSFHAAFALGACSLPCAPASVCHQQRTWPSFVDNSTRHYFTTLHCYFTCRPKPYHSLAIPRPYLALVIRQYWWHARSITVIALLDNLSTHPGSLDTSTFGFSDIIVPCMAVETNRHAKQTAATLDDTSLLQFVHNAMSLVPQHHSHGVRVLLPDHVSTLSSTDRLGPLETTFAGHEPITHAYLHSSKKRRSSKTKLPAELRRSSSTPHMRHLALGASGELSPTSSKPRNKLGYHRTSVACGHCRRRKIRCLLALDDSTGRCANCIRLKKECNFYPVEHNPDMPSSQTTGSKDASVGQPATPANSSPRHSLSIPGDKVGEFSISYSGASAAAPPVDFGFQQDPDSDFRHSSGQRDMSVQQLSFPYTHPIETQWPPTTTYLPSSTITESPPSNMSCWKQPPSSTNSLYGSESNFSGGHTPTAMSSSSTMSFGQQDGHWGQQPAFQSPARSMSYGNIEGLAQQYPGQGLGIQHDYPRRTSSFPYSFSTDTTQGTAQSSAMGIATTTSFSTPIVPSQTFCPASWNSYDPIPSLGSSISMTGQSMNGPWFPESGHLDRVQEEGASPLTCNYSAPPPFFSGA